MTAKPATPNLNKVPRFLLKFVGRGFELLPVKDGEIYAADHAWVRLSHVERAANEDLLADRATFEAAVRADERRKCFELVAEMARKSVDSLEQTDRDFQVGELAAYLAFELWANHNRDARPAAPEGTNL